MFTFRPATAADQTAIRSLVRGARINPSGLDWRRFLLVVGPGGQIIGCGQIKPHHDGSRELASIVVARPWRGRGLARTIIEQLMAGSVPPLWLTCASSLISLYERFGFIEVRQPGAMPPYFRRVRRLARLFFLFRPHQYLAVMRWNGPAELVKIALSN